MMVVVRVPTFVRLAILVPDDRDKLHTRFKQSPGGETRLPEQRQAIVVSKTGWLAIEMERLAHLRRHEEIESPLALAGILTTGCRLPEIVTLLLDLRQHRLAAMKRIEPDA